MRNGCSMMNRFPSACSSIQLPWSIFPQNFSIFSLFNSCKNKKSDVLFLLHTHEVDLLCVAPWCHCWRSVSYPTISGAGLLCWCTHYTRWGHHVVKTWNWSNLHPVCVQVRRGVGPMSRHSWAPMASRASMWDCSRCVHTPQEGEG